MLTRLSFSGLALGLLVCLSSFTAYTQPLSLIEKGRWGSPHYQRAVSIGNFTFAQAPANERSRIDIFDRRLEKENSLIGHYPFSSSINSIGVFGKYLAVEVVDWIGIYNVSDKGELSLLSSLDIEIAGYSCMNEYQGKLYVLGRKEGRIKLYVLGFFENEFKVLNYQEYASDNIYNYNCRFTIRDGFLNASDFLKYGLDEDFDFQVVKFPIGDNFGKDVIVENLNVGLDYSERFYASYYKDDIYIAYNRQSGELLSVLANKDSVSILGESLESSSGNGVEVVGDRVYLLKDSLSIFSIDSLANFRFIDQIPITGEFTSSVPKVEYSNGNLIAVSPDLGIYEVSLQASNFGEAKLYFNASGVLSEANFIGGKLHVRKSNTVHVLNVDDASGFVKSQDFTFFENIVSKIHLFNDNKLLMVDVFRFKYFDTQNEYVEVDLSHLISSCDGRLWPNTSFMTDSAFFVNCGGDRLLRYAYSNDSLLLSPPDVLEIDSDLSEMYYQNDVINVKLGGDDVVVGVIPGVKTNFEFYRLNDSELNKVGAASVSGMLPILKGRGNSWKDTRGFIPFTFLGYSKYQSDIYYVDDKFVFNHAASFEGSLLSVPFFIGDYMIALNHTGGEANQSRIYERTTDNALTLISTKEIDFADWNFFDRNPNNENQVILGNDFEVALWELNFAPELHNTRASLKEDTSFLWDLSKADREGDTIGVEITVGPNSGHVEFLPELASLRYTPSADFFGADTLSIRLSDEHGNFKDYQLAIEVQAVDDPPRPQAQSVSAKAGTTHKGQLANQDIDGDSLTYAVLQTTSNGALTLNANGSYSYTPNAGFSGTDKFTYQVSDSNGNTAQSEVQISVAKASTPPPATSSDSSGGGTLSWLLLALLWLSYLHQRRRVTKCYIGTGNR